MDWEVSHSFGQKVPPLYVEIKEVLQEYPDGQVFKVRASNNVRALMLSAYSYSYAVVRLVCTSRY